LERRREQQIVRLLDDEAVSGLNCSTASMDGRPVFGASQATNVSSFMNLTTDSKSVLETSEPPAPTLAEAASPSTTNSAETADQLSEHLVVIEPSRSWGGLRWRELWMFRELLYFLTWRDIKIRYKQTALGAAWAIIQPLFTMLIFTFAFGRVAKLDQQTGDIPYALALYVVLVPWTFFSSAVSTG
jgi:hypothetical protein